MISRKEREHSLSLIGKAKARLAFQHRLIAAMTSETDPHYATVARRTADLLRERIATMLRLHEALFEDADARGPRRFETGAVTSDAEETRRAATG